MFITSYLVAYCSVLRAWYIQMFIRRCSSFCYIVTCLFEFILMPKSSLQECYMLFTAVTYQNLMFCYFCCIWCVHLMRMRPTCVLIYAMPSLQGRMPCIFVIYMVSRTSMQTRLRDVSVFRDLGFCCLFLLLFWCHVSMCLQWDPCFFWACPVRMFCTCSCALSMNAPVCNYGVP